MGQAAAEAGDESPALDELSLEELLSLDLKVVSASKRAEDLSGTSAAIYVLTGEEIRRIGATSIPEALRVVPGMHVARADGSSWAVATRGFSGRFNTRMLVLVDGRSIFSPLFGGVFWEQQDTLLADVDRIEAIRGPGGTLWGVNAVNGVINILSKSAEDTQGLLATGGGGTEDRAFGSVRYGGKTRGLSYRVWSHYHDRAALAANEAGDRGNDPWKDVRGGFRMDWKLGAGDTLTLQGDAHDQTARSTYHYDIPEAPFLYTFEGKKDSDAEYVLSRWRHSFGEKRGLQVQAYYDIQNQDGSAANERRQTGDVDIHLDTPLGSRNSLIVGAGFRTSADTWEDRPDDRFLSLDPHSVRDDIFNLYAQDELRLFDDRLRIVLGSKFERNDYTGFEVQPNVRVNVRIGEDANAWAAVSRAVKTPARLFRDGTAPAGIFFIEGTSEYFLINVRGNPKLDSEELIAVEGGWRAKLLDAVSLDFAAFHNSYKGLIGANQDPNNVAFDPPNVYVPFENLSGGTVYGAELSAKWNLNERLAVAGGWSYQHSAIGRFGTTDEKSAPPTMANVRLYMNVTERLEWNVAGYYYDVSGRYDPSLLRGNDLVVDPIRRLDVGATFRPTRHLELAIWGQNLTEERHQEMKEGFVTPTSFVERSVYARLTTRFF